MRLSMTLLALALSGCPRAPADRPPEEPASLPPPDRLLVASPSAALWSKHGGTGSVLATVHQGVTVDVLERSGDWTRVSTTGPIEIAGWIRAGELGCRVSSDTPLVPEPGVEGDDPPLLRTGCTVRLLGDSGDWLHVETAPEPFTYFEKGSSIKDPVVVHIEPSGFLSSGWIPRSICSPDTKPFYPRAPKDGDLMIVIEETAILSEPGGPTNQIPGKVMEWTRWVSFSVDGTWNHGRTDGQVSVAGWLPITAVGPLPNTNPLNKLAEKKLKDYEVVAATEILDSKGYAITTIPGGQEIVKLDEDIRGCKVKTTPPVEVEGWMECQNVRNLSVLPEAAIEYGVVDGGYWPPDRGPHPNPLPVWPEQVEEEVEKE